MDYAASALVIGAALVVQRWVPAVDYLQPISPEIRADLYSKALGPLSIVASIATAALAIYATAQGPRVTLLRAVYGKKMLVQLRGAAVAPGLAVVALLVAQAAELRALALDAQSVGPAWARWLVLGALTFVLLRGGRVLHYYTGLLVTAGEDKQPEARRRSINELPVPPR